MTPQDAHICFICPYIEGYLKPGSGTHVGGAQRQQHLLGTYLRDAGWDVSYISFETEDGERYERLDGFDCWKTLPQTNDIRKTPTVLLKLLNSIRRIDADIFYVRGNPPLCILASYCCALLDERLVYVVANDSNVELSRLSGHHGMFKYTLPKLSYLDAMGRADHVVAQTEYQHDILGDIFGIDSTVISNGYTVPDESTLTEPADRGSVLWVGSLDPDQKRPERVLELADRLPTVNFRIVGWTNDDDYRESLLEGISERPNVLFEGFVPPDEIDQYYRDAVMLLTTSEYEGFPNTFLEAWRYGVPVVSLYEMLDGVIEDESLGVTAGSMERLEQVVRQLWEGPEWAAQLGSNGRAYFESNYAMDVVGSQYLDVFTDLLGHDPPRPTIKVKQL